MTTTPRSPGYSQLVRDIARWGRELGFQQIGVSDIDLSRAERQLERWLAKSRHGEMAYMAQHGTKRSRPGELLPGTIRVITVRMDYLPEPMAATHAVLESPELGFVSRYALGRDYHKLMRRRLQRLATRIGNAVGDYGYRVFVDSAPVLEKPLARKAGLGWVGKHTNLIHPRAGSYFFLGEIYTDLPLPTSTAPVGDHCGTCDACIRICPTGAIVAPYELDARRCISYLTIELKGAIPVELRPLVGNRIYGCDDCQLVCPWNRFAQLAAETGFHPKGELQAPRLIELFAWDESAFLRNLEGNPVRRIGYRRWLRNLAVALGNAPTTPPVVESLTARQSHPDELVREHVEWALGRHSPP